MERQETKTRLHCSAVRQNRRRAGDKRNWILILFEDHTINHHVVARADVMNADRDANLDFGSDDFFIQDAAAPSHISDGLAEAITAWSTWSP
jgi:hypothetical protein